VFRTVRFALLLALLAPAAACASSLYSGRGPRPGPDVLYAPPVSAPQLENTGIWQAEPILVSGATAYRNGEFLYQDWLYDDRGAGDAYSYPADPRYAGNAADLVELRLRPLEDELAIRLTYNSMVDPAVVASTIVLGSSPAAMALPHGANAVAPGRMFVTVHGTSADAVDAITGTTVNDALYTAVDPARRQVEVRVPYSVFDPRGQKLRVAAATGLWDAAGGAYVPQAAAAFFNVAFRSGEPAGPWRTSAQSAALTAKDLSPFFATVDFGKLTAGVTDDSAVPVVGFMDRIMVSANEDRQGRGDAVSRKPGCEAPCALQYSGRLQPYGLYVPQGAAAGGYGLTVDLHGCGQTYNIGFGTRRQRELGDRGTGSIVLTPEARGDCYWYFGQAAADVFEAWADVARRYTLDNGLVDVTGLSMGGYGAYKLAASYPDLFARAGVVVPCPGAGIEYTGTRGVPGGQARSIAPILPSLADVPVMSWQTTDDQACLYAEQAALVSRLAALGYRYASLTFSGLDHTSLATTALGNAEPLADFLGDARIDRNPPRVAYVVNPPMSEPARGLVADHAYWLSDVTPSRSDAPGRVDITSYGIGRRDATVPAATQSDGSLAGLPFVAVTHLGGDTQPATPAKRLRITAVGVRAVTVDAVRARTGCTPTIDVTTPQLLQVRLDGCNTTYAVKRVCHETPVFDLFPHAQRGEHLRSLKVTVGGVRVASGKGRVRVNAKRHSDLVARVRIVTVDSQSRVRVRSTLHQWCP
jgi:hypothetical protein